MYSNQWFRIPRRTLNTLAKNNRALRSCQKNMLKVPKTKLRYGGDRSFSVAALRIWNWLTNSIKSDSEHAFQKALKIHLFKIAYEC